jgi:hypothetical protein
MSARAQIFTRSTTSTSAAEAVRGGASSREPGVAELRPPVRAQARSRRVPSVQSKQLRNRAQDEETNENSCCHDDKKRGEHDNDEEPV